MRARAAVLLAALAASPACEGNRANDEPSASRSGEGRLTPEARARRLGRVLVEGDLEVFGRWMPDGPGTHLRVEVRQALTEHDERRVRELRGAEEGRAWLKGIRPHWKCEGPECRWPGGLGVPERWECYGDCCRRPAGLGVAEGTLVLRQACFAHRRQGEPALSLLVLEEAR